MGNFNPSISPYSSNFEQVLDPGIRDLVMVLINQGQLPASSCEGHAFHKPRYVTLCFGSREARERFEFHFSQNILKPFYPMLHMDTLSREEISGKVIQHTTLADEVRSLNHMFLRTHEQYFFLRLHVGAFFYTHKDMSSYRRYLNKFFVWGFNALTRGFLTRLLVKDLNQRKLNLI